MGFEIAPGACALVLPNLSLVESSKCSGAFSYKSLPSPPRHVPESKNVCAFYSLKESEGKVCQPLGHLQAVPRKKAPLSSIPIGSFPGTISLKAPQTLQGRKQNKVIPVFIDEKTEASII